jgi:hypothetical protein
MRILRGLSSKCLPCGCLAGVYETYDGLIVTIIDAKGTECSLSSHRNGAIVPAASSRKTLSNHESVTLQTDRSRADD